MKENLTDRPNSKELSEYFELLKFPTIGADPMHLRDCVQCAMWLKKWLEKIGAEAQLLLPEGGSALNAPPPVVFAEKIGDEGSPAILFYGHYDVQPPDPINEWRSPPFEPTEKDGRVLTFENYDDGVIMFDEDCEFGKPLDFVKVTDDMLTSDDFSENGNAYKFYLTSPKKVMLFT